MQQKLTKKYSKHLAKAPADNFKEKWLELHIDLTNTTEAIWDYNSIRYDTVMNAKEWKSFAQHPEREQFKSKMGFPSKESELYSSVYEFLKDSYAYYKTLGSSGYKNKLKVAISTLLDCTLNAQYDIESIRRSDAYFGRTPSQRDSGEVNPTLISLNRLNYAIDEYAYYAEKNVNKLRRKIYDICEGRITVLVNFYSTCDVEETLREDIIGIFKILNRDLTLRFEDIKLGWKIWKQVRDIGMDVDSYLEMIDLPKYAVVEKNLLTFLKNKKYAEEILLHMKDELPESYKKYKKEGYIKRQHLTAEEAKKKKYPKQLRKPDEIKKMIEECKREINKIFPLAKKQTPTNVLLNPLHPQSTMRAFQSMLKNDKGKRMSIVVMTPRALMKDEYLPVLAHETTHSVHRRILGLAEEKGLLEKGSSERVPSSVLEDFSQLVEHQFYKDTNLPYEKKYKGEEFPNLISGLASRAQVPFSLVQLGIRKEFDKMWNEDIRGDIPEEKIWDLKNQFDILIRKLEKTGVYIRNDLVTSLNYFVSHNPDDGLVYMKRYIVKSKEKANDEKTNAAVVQTDMATAFKEKYGKNWVEQKEARAKLLWLFIESGRNYETQNFHKFIKDKNVEECYEELKIAGITKKDI